MKPFLIILLLLGAFLHARADPPAERWDTIPDISSLRVDGGAVVLSSEHMYLRHMLANGSEYGGTIAIETGNLAYDPLHQTIKVGESVFWEGISDHIAYKLVSIHDGVCAFECSGWDRGGREFKKAFTITLYPKA